MAAAARRLGGGRESGREVFGAGETSAASGGGVFLREPAADRGTHLATTYFRKLRVRANHLRSVT